MPGKIFGKKKKEEYLIVNINGKLRPLDRGELYEDPLDELLSKSNIGSVVGGGTLQSKTGEIENCDIEVLVIAIDSNTLTKVKEVLDEIGLPKGSLMQIEKTGEEIPIGNKEGLALYLNGTDLPEETYKNSDINLVIDSLENAIKGIGKMESYWEGPKETALYFYGSSFNSMKDSMQDILEQYPLCQKSRIVQIA